MVKSSQGTNYGRPRFICNFTAPIGADLLMNVFWVHREDLTATAEIPRTIVYVQGITLIRVLQQHMLYAPISLYFFLFCTWCHPRTQFGATNARGRRANALILLGNSTRIPAPYSRAILPSIVPTTNENHKSQSCYSMYHYVSHYGLALPDVAAQSLVPSSGQHRLY